MASIWMDTRRSECMRVAAALVLAGALAKPSPADEPSFLARPSIRVGLQPSAIASGDVDGDGDLDLVVANKIEGTVSVIRNLGHGSFSQAVDFPAGTAPAAVALGDFDADGDLDLAVGLDHSISILWNLGGGAFGPAETIPGEATRVLVAKDLDGDGVCDLAALGYVTAVGVHLSRGDGTFDPPVMYAARYEDHALVVDDLDGDGHPDLAVAGGPAGVLVFWNRGHGTFSSTTTAPSMESLTAIAAGDVDGDGDMDLVGATGINGSWGVHVIRNQGGRTFALGVPYAWQMPRAQSIALGDFDGDGDLDIAAGDSSPSGLRVLANTGNGGFPSWASYEPGAGFSTMTVADLDGDGDLDLAGTESSETVNVLLNPGNGAFDRIPTCTFGGLILGKPAIGDIDGDHDSDVVAGVSGGLAVLSNDGHGAMSAPVLLPIGTAGYPVIADLDGDGNLDIVASRPSANDVAVLLNSGGGNFAPLVAYGIGAEPREIRAADLDADGDLDLAVANAARNVSILKNRGDGTFDPPVSYATNLSPSSLTLADIDGDGDLDLLTLDVSEDLLAVHKNLGNGTFGPLASYPTGHGATSAAVGDLDHDGDLDVLVASFMFADHQLRILVNAGNGTFPTYRSIDPTNAPERIALVDLDGDGDLDVIGTDFQADCLSTMLQDADGNLVVGPSFGVGYHPGLFALGDLDGDGDADVIAADSDATGTILSSSRFTGTVFCTGDGIDGHCPCGNDSSSGANAGCRNASGRGATLNGTGAASLSADSLVLVTTHERPTATSVVFQGNSVGDPTAFGQGLRCVQGNLKRLYVKSAVAGSIAAPDGADVSVTVRSAQKGDVIAVGAFRCYGVYYRDPIVPGGCPSTSTFNVTNQLAIWWVP